MIDLNESSTEVLLQIELPKGKTAKELSEQFSIGLDALILSKLFFGKTV